MIQDDMDITVEAGAFENDAHSGKRGRVVKVIGCFAVIQIEGVDGCRACTVDNLQPRWTAHNLSLPNHGIAQPLSAASYAERHKRWSQDRK